MFTNISGYTLKLMDLDRRSHSACKILKCIFFSASLLISWFMSLIYSLKPSHSFDFHHKELHMASVSNKFNLIDPRPPPYSHGPIDGSHARSAFLGGGVFLAADPGGGGNLGEFPKKNNFGFFFVKLGHIFQIIYLFRGSI
jgi:hypothetical protein